MENARENRRRRIVERGTDRLAFITGKTDTLPKSSIVPAIEDNNATDANLPKRETTNEVASNLLDANSKANPSISSSNQSSSSHAVSSSFLPPSDHALPTDPQPSSQPNNRRLIFSASSINSSISASENFRLMSSAIIAFLAILLYTFNPMGNRTIMSMTLFRPLYLVLLTDASIVIGLLLTKGGSSKTEAEARKAAANSDDWTHRLGKILEVGLVLQKGVGAFVMDCSVCAVLLISGFSILRLV